MNDCLASVIGLCKDSRLIKDTLCKHVRVSMYCVHPAVFSVLLSQSPQCEGQYGGWAMSDNS